MHGDDFTALGTDKSLDMYEKGLAEHFECKVKGRLGVEDKDAKEMRILNRIVRITPKGLSYEADPRHVELLARSMGLEGCKTVYSPGIKHPFQDECLDAQLNDDHDPGLLCPLMAMPARTSRITFSEDVTEHTVMSYSEIYGMHPKTFVFGKNGRVELLSTGDDKYTGLSKSQMMERRELRHTGKSHRRAQRLLILRRALGNCSAWERSTTEIIAALGKKTFVKKRLDAKAAKQAERFASVGEAPNDSESTSFRALAARANYLSLIRPDCAFATKELCCCFAHPTKTAAEALRRLVRYLVGAPRVIWEYLFQDEVSEF